MHQKQPTIVVSKISACVILIQTAAEKSSASEVTAVVCSTTKMSVSSNMTTVTLLARSVHSVAGIWNAWVAGAMWSHKNSLIEQKLATKIEILFSLSIPSSLCESNSSNLFSTKINSLYF